MKRIAMRYPLVALGVGLLALASCKLQSLQNDDLTSRRHYTPAEWAKIEHTRQLIDRTFPGMKITPHPGLTVEDVLLLEGDSMVYRMVDALRAKGAMIPEPIDE